MPTADPRPQGDLDAIIAKEQVAKQKIHAMQSDMHMLKNQVRLEEELRECDRRLSFLHRLRDSVGDGGELPTLHTLNGYKMWTRRELSVPLAQRKIVELTALFVREEKLRVAYEQMQREREARGCGTRMGLLKECIDRYTALLPDRLLQECGGGGEVNGEYDVVVRRSRGRQCRVAISIDSLSVDRFDDQQYRVELLINNELVTDDLLATTFVLKQYNSHVGAKLEFYVYNQQDHSRALSMAAFTVISAVQISHERIHMEPRGHFDLTIAFTPTATATELKRAMAVTKARQQAELMTFTYQRHRFKVAQSVVPVKCSHCHGLCVNYLKCRDCGQASHDKCVGKLVNECLPNANGHKPTCLASFNVPHLFTPVRWRWEWCVHCGRHLWSTPLPYQQCTECQQCCHVDCLAYLPAHCGLSNKLKKALPLTASLDHMQPHTDSPLANYEMLKTVGRGSFGKVVVAKHKPTNRLMAMKVLKKSDIARHNEHENVQTEFRILSMIKRYKDPFCIGLADVFQTRERVYFVSEFVPGGDLMYHIQQRPFTDDQVQYHIPHLTGRFLAAQIVLGLDFMHKHGVIYRDLKLDNVLIGADGYIKLADFGLSKDGMLGDTQKTSTFCGTPEFMAPEIIKEEPYGRSVDWWAFGVCLYEMLVCQAPFPGDNETDIYDAIFEHNLQFPDHITDTGRNLITACLQLDPSKRIGSGATDAEELKRHPFFHKIDFGQLHGKRLKAPFLPPPATLHDVATNFDPEFTAQPTTLSPIPSADLISMHDIKMV